METLLEYRKALKTNHGLLFFLQPVDFFFPRAHLQLTQTNKIGPGNPHTLNNLTNHKTATLPAQWSLMMQWLALLTRIQEDVGLIPTRGTAYTNFFDREYLFIHFALLNNKYKYFFPGKYKIPGLSRKRMNPAIDSQYCMFYIGIGKSCSLTINSITLFTNPAF